MAQVRHAESKTLGQPLQPAAQADDGQGLLRRVLVSGGLLAPLLALGASLLGTVAILGAFWTMGGHIGGADLGTAFALAAAAALAFGLIVHRAAKKLLQPLEMLETWARAVSQGEPGVAPPGKEAGLLAPVIRDVNSLSDELTDLYDDMDNRVARQTRRLAQKNASLKILYDVAASINDGTDLEALLIRFLRVLKEMINARAATVRLLAGDGAMRLVGSIGLDDAVLQRENLLPLQLCPCGTALSPGDILCEKHSQICSRFGGRTMFNGDQVERIDVPLEYHEEILGVYNLFVDKAEISEREDILQLLETIGSHLGVAIAKQRSDEEAKRLSIIEERTNLAHELHDSLAQTLASLRFQVRVLDETLAHGDSKPARRELDRIKNGLDEAHTELRELLANFRTELDQRGLIPALEQMVSRFRKETGIATFLQRDCRRLNLNPNEEMHALRIVQEALTNIRKHSQAQTVRILLRCRVGEEYLVLVEDDGLGFSEAARDKDPGEHIGLSIMQERARRCGGDLRVESEPGEGARVELILRPGRTIKASSPHGENAHARAAR